MKTIGQLLKDARGKKRYSLKKLEDLTKIKKDFLDAIEKEHWEALPSFSTTLGFVKSIAANLGIDVNKASVTLKRDYPPKKFSINPKPDVSSHFVWGPKLTFAVGVGLVLALILGYLFFQYSRFISPPSLSVLEPRDGEIISGNSVYVKGKTDTDTILTVNNQPVITDQEGKFSIELEISKQTNEIVIKSVSRSGKETVISRRIEVQ